MLLNRRVMSAASTSSSSVSSKKRKVSPDQKEVTLISSPPTSTTSPTTSNPPSSSSSSSSTTKEEPKQIVRGKELTEFEKAGLGSCDALAGVGPQLNYGNGQAGLGVIIDDFGGDINWNVYVRRDKDGLTTEVIMRTERNGPPVTEEEKVGLVVTDAGNFVIADSCYILPNDPNAK
jgi:hypothetical protein